MPEGFRPTAWLHIKAVQPTDFTIGDYIRWFGGRGIAASHWGIQFGTDPSGRSGA